MISIESTKLLSILFYLFGAIVISISYDSANYHDDDVLEYHKNSSLKASSRIIGGEIAKVGQFPFLATIFIKIELKNHKRFIKLNSKEQFNCGASIINERYILTAAHCLERFNIKQNNDLFIVKYIVKVGLHRLFPKESKNTKTHSIKKVHIHKKYVHGKAKYDIAIAELDEKIIFRSFRDGFGNTKQIKLNTKQNNNYFTNQYLTAAGWGATIFGTNTPSSVLKYGEYKIVNPKYAAKLLDKKVSNSSRSSILQAQVDLMTNSLFVGDSGSPLFKISYKNGKTTYTQIGIASAVTYKHNKGNDFAFFCSIYENRDWIKRIIG